MIKVQISIGIICNQEELSALNSVVSAYLEFAEMQARRRIPMYMANWIETLDGFLKLSKHEIPTNAGKISAKIAESKAKELGINILDGKRLF